MRRPVRRWMLASMLLSLSACATSQPVSLPGGQVVRGESGLYELVTGAGWERIPPQREGDLELLNRATGAEVVVRVSKAASLDEVVSVRRASVLERAPDHYREQRFFLAGGDLIPASLVRYTKTHAGETVALQILTVHTMRGAIEVVSAGRLEDEAQLNDLLGSLRLTESR